MPRIHRPTLMRGERQCIWGVLAALPVGRAMHPSVAELTNSRTESERVVEDPQKPLSCFRKTEVACIYDIQWPDVASASLSAAVPCVGARHASAVLTSSSTLSAGPQMAAGPVLPGDGWHDCRGGDLSGS